MTILVIASIVYIFGGGVLFYFWPVGFTIASVSFGIVLASHIYIDGAIKYRDWLWVFRKYG